MKKISLFVSLAFFFLSLNTANAQFSGVSYTSPKRAEFFNTTTLFVLFGAPNIHDEIKKIVKETWTVTPYRFILPEQLNEYARDEKYSVCLPYDIVKYVNTTTMTSLPNSGFPNSGIGTTSFRVEKNYYGVINCSDVRKVLFKEFGPSIGLPQEKFLAYTLVDDHAYEQHIDDLINRLKIVLIQMQEAYRLTDELKLKGDANSMIQDFLDYYSINMLQLENKTLYINRKCTLKYYGLYTPIKEKNISELYPFPYQVVTDKEINDAIDRKDSTVAILLQTANTAMQSQFVFITDAGTCKPIYAGSGSANDSFLKKLTRELNTEKKKRSKSATK